MMNVRDKRSNTIHKKQGPLERGFFRTIPASDYSPDLFQIVPQCPEDIPIKCMDSKGRMLSDDRIAAARKKKYAYFVKNLKQQYEDENKLAIERLKGRI